MAPSSDPPPTPPAGSADAESLPSRRRVVDEFRARLAAVVESSDDAIISKTLTGIISTWNPSAQRMFGYTPEEAIGRHITLLIPPDRTTEEAAIIERLKRGERIDHYETIRVRKDGTLVDVSLTVSPVRDESGAIVGASKIARDITARKRLDAAMRESESRLRAVVEATPECVKIVSPEGRLLFMNPVGIGLIEAESMEAVHDCPVQALIAPEHRAEWLRRHARICAGERMNWEFELVGLHGTRRWLESHAVPLLLPDGRNGHLAVTREITSRKVAELEREQLLERERAARSVAERAGVIKDEFLATLSHELRTPLNAIVGWSQILRSRDYADEELHEGITVIERNARVQTQLIEDLLDMSRITSGKIRLDVQTVDLQEVIAAAVDAVRHSADAKQIRLQVILDPLASAVRGDPGRLQQCCWNLLSNAVKFTPRGGRVQVSLERINSHLEFTVTDTGQGIMPELLPHIFERFRQGDSSLTREHGGLGLGLSIVKHLIELHGGKVPARSAGTGNGSTFVVELPLMILHNAEQRPRPEHPRAASLKSPCVDHPSLIGITVLAIDDQPDARSLIRRLLEECGATVFTAASAAEGMEYILRQPPDVIVSDIGLPEEDGYDFIRKVRALPAEKGGKIPAAALTAFARPEDRLRALRAGYQTHIAKPVEPAELTTVIASLALRH